MNMSMTQYRISTWSLILMALIFLPVALAQEDDASQEKARKLAQQERKSVALLRSMDSKIYRARDNGLKDVYFRHHFRGDGAMADVDFYIAFWWKQPYRQRLEFQDAAGKKLRALPASLATNPKAVSWLKSSTEAMAHQRLMGLPFEKVYRDYHKSVTERLVNNELEQRLILVPKKRKLFNRITIIVREGLPREILKSSETGRSVHLFYRYEQRGKQHLCVGMTNEVANRVMLEEKYTYVTQKDVLILQKITRLSNSGPTKKTIVELEDIKANQDLPNSFFDPKK